MYKFVQNIFCQLNVCSVLNFINVLLKFFKIVREKTQFSLGIKTR